MGREASVRWICEEASGADLPTSLPTITDASWITMFVTCLTFQADAYRLFLNIFATYFTNARIIILWGIGGHLRHLPYYNIGHFC